MSYRGGESDEPKNTPLGLLLKLGAFAVAFIVAKAIVSGGFAFVERKSTQPANVERIVQANPDLAAMYGPLKEFFPGKYNEVIAHVAELARSGASEQEISAYTFNASRQFVTSHMDDIAGASTDTLVQIAKLHSDIASALANESKTACAEFGMTGVNQSTAASLSKTTLGRFSNGAGLMFRAAHEGTVSPINRGKELSEEDAKALITAVRDTGLSDDKVEVLFSERVSQASVPDQCRMTVALYEAVASLPAEQSARITAFLLRGARA